MNDFSEIEAETRRTRPSTRTLAQVMGVFVRHRTPALILALASGAGALRLALGAIRASEAVLLLIVALYWPVQEWAAHRFILHLRPRTVCGVRVDPYFARRHRRHHQNPAHFPDVFLPVGVVVGAFAVFFAAVWAVAGAALAASALTIVSLAALLYEWTHFLAHTDYPPRSAWARRIVRNHRLHHYRNEQRWFAFTVPYLDDWLSTGGEASQVPRSATTRTLGQPVI